MRIPSRSMAKLNRGPKSFVAWCGLGVLILGLLSGTVAWVFSNPLVAVPTGIVLAVLVTVSSRNSKRRLDALAKSRPGESICQFARSFDSRAVDTWIIRAVYEETQALFGSSPAGFPLRASDRFDALGLDDEDLEMDLAPSVSRRTGRSLIDPKANPHFGKLLTVADLVMFFNAQPLTARTTEPRHDVIAA